MKTAPMARPDWTDPVAILQALVAIPSINPMGRMVTGPEFLETRLTEFLVLALTEVGVPFEVVEVVPGRSNIVARIETGHVRTVQLDAHQDTVPVEGMTIDPFLPNIDGDRLYGRGSCDVKGGMAAMLAAFVRLHRQLPPGLCNVVLSLTVDEEATSLGIDHLVDSWLDRSTTPTYRLLPHPPTVAIVAEPTGLQAVVAHRGATRWKLHTAGIACHSSRPQDGISAIYRMRRVLEALEDYAERLPSLRPPHPLCGPATLSVGRIEGGSSVNVVPDGCSIDIDRRVIPGEDSAQVIPLVLEYLATRIDFPVQADAPFLMSPPLGNELNGPWATVLLETAAPLVGLQAQVGVAYGTHASRIALAGSPAVVYGPGDIAQAHTKDEWISITQLRQVSDIYERFCQIAGTAYPSEQGGR